MLVTFTNVRISIEAASPTEAYNQLCALLETKEDTLTYTTDTFCIEHSATEVTEDRDTSELWPVES